MGRLIVITGGSRSGKSRFAQDMAGRIGGDSVTFIATSQALDAEMAARIAAHQADRPDTWRTVESPTKLAQPVRECDTRAALIDCLTLFVTNVMLAREDDFAAAEATVEMELDDLAAAAGGSGTDVIVVTNEVGMGIVPPTPLGRAFRDIAGRAGQLLARHADEVYLTVLGIPTRLK